MSNKKPKSNEKNKAREGLSPQISCSQSLKIMEASLGETQNFFADFSLEKQQQIMANLQYRSYSI